jgi:hypothetical protein
MVTGHRAQVTACMYLGAAGLYCASASRDGTLKLWSLATGQCLYSLCADRPLCSLALAGKTLIVGDALGTLSVFDLRMEQMMEPDLLAALEHDPAPTPARWRRAAVDDETRAWRTLRVKIQIVTDHLRLMDRPTRLLIDLHDPSDDLSPGTLYLTPGRGDDPHRLLRRTEPPDDDDRDAHAFVLWSGVEDELDQLLLWCQQHADRFVQLGDALLDHQPSQDRAWALRDELEDDLCSAMLSWGAGGGS